MKRRRRRIRRALLELAWAVLCIIAFGCLTIAYLIWKRRLNRCSD